MLPQASTGPAAGNTNIFTLLDSKASGLKTLQSHKYIQLLDHTCASHFPPLPSITRCSLILYLFERLQRWNELCFIISVCSKCTLLTPSLHERFILSFETVWDEGNISVVLCKWTLTDWGRRTGNASPPASPSGRPAGSYGCTALSHTCSRFLRQDTNIKQPPSVPETSRAVRQRSAGDTDRDAASCFCCGGWVSDRHRDTKEKQRQRNWEGKWVCGLRTDRFSL